MLTPAEMTIRDPEPSNSECLSPAKLTFASPSPVQQSAMELFDAGFNVMPIPRVGMEYDGEKPPYGPFSMLFATRLDRAGLPILFDRSNLAVIVGRLSHNLFVLDCDEARAFD